MWGRVKKKPRLVYGGNVMSARVVGARSWTRADLCASRSDFGELCSHERELLGVRCELLFGVVCFFSLRAELGSERAELGVDVVVVGGSLVGCEGSFAAVGLGVDARDELEVARGLEQLHGGPELGVGPVRAPVLPHRHEQRVHQLQLADVRSPAPNSQYRSTRTYW